MTGALVVSALAMADSVRGIPGKGRRLTKYGLPTEPWVTPAAILQSATALKQAVGGAPHQHRPQLDRLWLTPRYLIISRWNDTCAYAKQKRIVWPVSTRLEEALSDLERSLKDATIEFIASGRRPASWLRNGSGIDLSQRCN